MKIFAKITLVLLLGCVISSSVMAQFAKKIYDDEEQKNKIKVGGFIDYPPVGYLKKVDRSVSYETVFHQIMDDFAQNTNSIIAYETEGDYKDIVTKVQGGDLDLLLGSYHETKLYEGLEFVFPSMINNPISIIMLPKNANKIRTLTQLKKLKGGISNKEHLSDYVNEQLADYDIERFDSSYKMFEKLYTGQIDYIFASHFFGIVESAKLGLRDRLSFSKQVIWNMPLFLGVSKMSPYRKFLTGKLSSYSENPANKEKLEAYLKKMINDLEIYYRGVVPPPYSLNDDESEPAVVPINSAPASTSQDESELQAAPTTNASANTTNKSVTPPPAQNLSKNDKALDL